MCLSKRIRFTMKRPIKSKKRYKIRYAGSKTGWIIKSCGDLVEKEKIIDYIKLSIMEAINDLEPVEVGTNTERILNLKTFGPNNSTELISTISSIVAVSKIIAPLTFIVAIIFVLVWIFLL